MIDYDKLADLYGVDGLSDLYITFSEIDGSPLVYPVLNVNGKRVLGHNCIQGIHHHQVVETTLSDYELAVYRFKIRAKTTEMLNNTSHEHRPR